jgi:tetratricopeptide (TPR) repeat protein
MLISLYVFFNTKNFKKSLEHANKALDSNPSHAKALYRKALAQVELGDYEEADRTYEKALEVEPENKAIKKARSKVKRILERQEQKEQKLYGKLFSSYSKEIEEETKNQPKEEKKRTQT